MLFLCAKRTPSEGVIFSPISNPATQFAPRKVVFVIILFSINNLIKKIFKNRFLKKEGIPQKKKENKIDETIKG
jgi:hypothetical protein